MGHQVGTTIPVYCSKADKKALQAINLEPGAAKIDDFGMASRSVDTSTWITPDANTRPTSFIIVRDHGLEPGVTPWQAVYTSFCLSTDVDYLLSIKLCIRLTARVNESASES